MKVMVALARKGIETDGKTLDDQTDGAARMYRLARLSVNLRLKMISVLALVALSACSSRGAITVDPSAGDIGTAQQILVATTRGPDDADAGAVLSRERSQELSFLDFTVSVPPDRAPGSVVFPASANANPQTDFLTVSRKQLPNKKAFLSSVRERLAQLPPENQEVLLFVHGFNTNFAEGLYRQAQIRHDFGTKGVSINYAWPSLGDVRGYAYDRDSVLFARDGLEDVLTAVAETPAKRIILNAHSLGSQLVLETLRQMAIRGSDRFFDKLAAVVLFHPDLDVDLFREQVRSFGDKDVPIYVFVSNRDRALRFSSFIHAGAERLGVVRDLDSLQDLPISIIDISRVAPGNDQLLHSKAATSPMMVSMMGGMGTAGLEMFRQEDRRPTILESGLHAAQILTDGTVGALVP